MDPDLPEHPYLATLIARLDNALATARRAVYLTGSTAVGAYRPGHSDLDVLVAVHGASPAQLDAIVARCSHEALPCPATKLELVVYETAVLASPGDVRWSLNFDTGRSVHHVGRDPSAEPSHWFVLDLAFAGRHAIPLAGPPARELIAEPPADAIREALAGMVAWYADHEPAQAGVAAARARHWERTGSFAPKRAVTPRPESDR